MPHATAIPNDTSRNNRSSDSYRLTVGLYCAGLADRFRGRGDGWKWLCSPISSLFEALAIGVMRRRNILQMVRRTYESRRDFYNPKQYSLPHESRLLNVLKQHRPSGALLDSFCGQGREAKLFAEAGYQVTAIDRLDWMIESAEQYLAAQGVHAHLHVADFDHYHPAQRFDISYTSCWMYSTVQGAIHRHRFLERLDDLTCADGMAVISYLSSRNDNWLGNFLRWSVARIAGLITAGNVRCEFGERIYTGLFWHHLADGKVRHEVQGADWRIVETLIGTGTEPTFLLLRKQNPEAKV